MSKPNRPPSPVQPHDFDDAVRGMTNIHLPPAFPVNSFLGHPDRYHGNPVYQTQPIQQPFENTRWTRWNSGQAHAILPPLRMQPSAGPSSPSAFRRNTHQAVPISKLLADPSCSPPRTNVPPLPRHALTRHDSDLTSSPGPSCIADRSRLPIALQSPTSAYLRSADDPPMLTSGNTSPRRVSLRRSDSSSHVSSPSVSSSSGSSLNSPRQPGSSVSTRQRLVPRASQPPDVKYSLSMRQQPVAARACGFGERDRRVVDPPPIVQVEFVDKASNPDDDETSRAITTLICTIVHADTMIDASSIEQSRNDMAITQRLMGTCVASTFTGKDERGIEGTFFVFPDLSCRSPGKYRFLFRLLVVDPFHLEIGKSTKIQAQIYSDQFEVFSAKEFPGMRASSGLLVTLRKQGLNVAVKKGREATKKSTRKIQHEEYDSDEDEEMAEDDDEGNEPDPKKRKRIV